MKRSQRLYSKLILTTSYKTQILLYSIQHLLQGVEKCWKHLHFFINLSRILIRNITNFFMEIESSSHLLSDEVNFFIVVYRIDGKTYDQIAKLLENKLQKPLYRGTIEKIWKEFQEYGNVINNWHGGRPRLFTAKEIRAILAVVKNDRTTTAKYVYRHSKLNVHQADYTTIAAILNQTGMKASIPRGGIILRLHSSITQRSKKN